MNHKEFKRPSDDIRRIKNVLKDDDSTIKTAPNNVEFANSMDEITLLGGLKTKALVEMGEKMLIEEYKKSKKKKRKI